MHDYTVATLAIYNVYGERGRDLFRRIAEAVHLLASGFAEGQPGQSIRISKIRAVPTEGGYLLTGSKKPCSLSSSMDWLFASAALEDPGSGEPRYSVALLPAGSPGIERRPFWRSPVLIAAESDEVVLQKVFVPTELFYVIASDDQVLDQAEVGGTIWFELLATASYLGVASSLVERLLQRGKGSAADRARLAGAIDNAMSAVEGVAPPSRASIAGPLADYLSGASMHLV